MRILAVFAIALGASAQQPPFTLDQVLSSAFPTELTAAPAGGKVAWVSNAKGVRNIMLAEPPGYQARKITAYTADDGQEMGDLAWTPDASAIVYVRGDSANRAGEYPNPALDPNGAEQDLWIVALDGSAPRKIGEGHSPAVSPRGDPRRIHPPRPALVGVRRWQDAPARTFKRAASARDRSGRPMARASLS